MKTLRILVLPSILILVSSCEKNEIVVPLTDDEKILQLVYSSYKYPAGFYHEDLTRSSIYYENTVSILPLAARQPRWVELCTDARGQALAWSESSSANSSYWRPLVSERQTEKYFEFQRRDTFPSSWALLSRVHKCSYLDRSMYDRSKPDSILGIFNKRPLTLPDSKELVEYLWFVDNYEIGGAKVLSLAAEDSANVFQIIIMETAVSYGDWDVHDMIAVYQSTYRVNKGDGILTRNRTLQKVIEGRLN
jgi:hypothetical protein